MLSEEEEDEDEDEWWCRRRFTDLTVVVMSRSGRCEGTQETALKQARYIRERDTYPLSLALLFLALLLLALLLSLLCVTQYDIQRAQSLRTHLAIFCAIATLSSQVHATRCLLTLLTASSLRLFSLLDAPLLALRFLRAILVSSAHHYPTNRYL